MKTLKTIAILTVLTLPLSCQPENNPDETREGGGDSIVHVSGITLNKPTATIKEGEGVLLVATVKPDNAENKNVSWSSSETAIASVDHAGHVTGITPGSATVTAKTEDGGKTASCVITVEPNDAPSITLGTDHVSAICAVLNGRANLSSSTSADLKLGFQYSKSAGILPTNSTTVFVSDASADYHYSTRLDNLDPGTTYYFRSLIRQSNHDDEYGAIKAFTTKGVDSLIETKDASGIGDEQATLHAKLDLTDIYYYDIEYGFYWGTSENRLNNTLIGGDISDHTYSAKMANLTSKTQYWYRAYVKIDGPYYYGEVKSFTTEVIPVTSVSLNETKYTINTIGTGLYLIANVLPKNASDKSVEWASSNTDVATVDQNGMVIAKDNGTATITVTTKDQGKTANCAITVAQAVTGIRLNKTSLSLNMGESLTLTATVNPENAADKSLKWSSSDTSIATVDKNGKVTAKSKGHATIKAEAQDGSGKYATCTVTVVKLITLIKLGETSLVMHTGETTGISYAIAPGDASNQTLSWTSSNNSIAKVSSTGQITAKAPGNVTITAKATDGSGVEASCEVEVRQYVTGITLNKASLDFLPGDTWTLTATASPASAYDKNLDWSIDNPSIATLDAGVVTAIARGKATITVSARDGSGKTATCVVIVSNFCPKGAVDLGFRTSDGFRVYWATGNLSASSLCANPEDYGDYFAWGETKTKSDYSWSTYKWCEGGHSTLLTRYNTSYSYGRVVDNKTSFRDYYHADDAAHAVLGGNWRTPDDFEWTELREKCTWTWTNNYNGTGVPGRIITSNVTGYTNNSIFLPAAGNWADNSLVFERSSGTYWSSSLNTETPDRAWGVGFGSSKVSRLSTGYRRYGYSVRPVSD